MNTSIKNPLLAKCLKLTEMSSTSLCCVNPGARGQERSVGAEGGFVIAMSVLDGSHSVLPELKPLPAQEREVSFPVVATSGGFA